MLGMDIASIMQAIAQQQRTAPQAAPRHQQPMQQLAAPQLAATTAQPVSTLSMAAAPAMAYQQPTQPTQSPGGFSPHGLDQLIMQYYGGLGGFGGVPAQQPHPWGGFNQAAGLMSAGLGGWF